MPVLAVTKERRAGETRVAVTPDAAKKLIALGFDVVVETGAGLAAAAPDADYEAAGAKIVGDSAAALQAAEVDAVLHFSKRSAESYLAGAAEAGVAGEALAVRHICLSAQIAAPLADAGAGRIAVAPRPEEAALIASLERPQG